ncbi:hypothetical protein TeGR_g4348 [Tetraparma gracilis]|uniref:Uncharacterized protein n=1 Tax=Tetraparma gracilis TaxID=2962635 RepID=A0ABQ6MKB5_9STRA|nr:hypothetical protein TeGR_g4348 [Tetraparma gracilis]
MNGLLTASSSSAELELECIVNSLLGKFQRMREEKVKDRREMEVEEEHVINGLLRKMAELGREKRELEERVAGELEGELAGEGEGGGAMGP